MYNIIFECEVVTPMFIYGADKKTTELRPPSIKGVMRFWWRAINGHLSIDELRKKEAQIFGGSGDNEGKSKIIVKFNNLNLLISDTLWNEIEYIEKRANSGKIYKLPKYEKGLTYLFYSVLSLNEKAYIKAGSTFMINIKYLNEEIYSEIISLFKVLSLFGGFGTRERRGAGSFIIKKGLEDNFYGNKIKTGEDLAKYIEKEIKPLIDRRSKNYLYSVLNNAKVFILEPKNNWIEALNFIGDLYQNYRYNSKDKITDTPNFGFPIIHRDKKNRGRKILFGAGPKEKKRDEYGNILNFLERRASPLIFKVVKTQQNCFIPIILWLNGDLIPFNYEIMDKKGNYTENSNRKIIEEFISFLKSKSQKFIEEVLS